MATVNWTPIALAELEDILFHIAVRDRRPETAENIYFEIRSFVDNHAQNSIPGHNHDALPKEWLYWMHKRWMIVYEAIEESIVVHRIVDASRNLPRTF